MWWNGIDFAGNRGRMALTGENGAFDELRSRLAQAGSLQEVLDKTAGFIGERTRKRRWTGRPSPES